MLSIIGAFVGFISSLAPQLLKYFQDQSDKKHELEVLKLQMEAQKQGHTQRLEEINAQADIEESKALYSYAQAKQAEASGNRWIDGITAVVFTFVNAVISLVRPTVTYAYFGLYAFIKVEVYKTSGNFMLIWTESDMAIFSGIMGHWFGSRIMQRFFGKAR